MADKKFRRYRFIDENELKGYEKEIAIKSQFDDGVHFEELLGAFRQFLVMLGYSESMAKSLIVLGPDELERLMLKPEDLEMYNWESIYGS